MKNLSFLLVAILLTTVPASVFGATVYTLGSGSWGDANNWLVDPNVNRLPDSKDWTYIQSLGHTIDAVPGAEAGHLIVGRWRDGGVGTLNVDAGDTIVVSGRSSQALGIGYTVGPNTAGVLNMTGGSVDCKGYVVIGHRYNDSGIARGTLNMSGGHLDIHHGRFHMGWDGGICEINHSGGTIELSDASTFFYMGFAYDSGYSEGPTGNTKYTISGDASLIVNGSYNYIHYFAKYTQSAHHEFRIVGPDVTVEFQSRLTINSGYSQTTPLPLTGGCTLGFDIDPNIAPITMVTGWMNIRQGTIFDFNGGHNGESYLIAQAIDTFKPEDNIIFCNIPDMVVTEPSTYELRLSADKRQLWVDVINPVCNIDSNADLDGDCDVDLQDAILMFNNWLAVSLE